MLRCGAPPATIRACRSMAGLEADDRTLRNGLSKRAPSPLAPHRYYPVVRLLAGVRVGRTALAFAHRSAVIADRHRRGLPVLVQEVSRRAWGLRPRRARRRLAMASAPVWPSASEHCVGARNEFFHGSIPSPPVPLSTLHPRCRHRRRMTRGQDGSLLLHCGALSSPTPCRFIPALSLCPL